MNKILKYTCVLMVAAAPAPAAMAQRTIITDQDGYEWVRKSRKGMIVSKDTLGVIRAMAPLYSNPSAGSAYVDAVNAYADSLPAVKVYAVVAPQQGDFYMPEAVDSPGKERETIRAAMKGLSTKVTPVFVGDSLAKHVNEPIFSRTDHHWAPLGAYYAASALAAAAKVPFAPLSEFDTDTIHNYVGTMSMYSGDPAVKTAYEDFVYYRPRGDYKTRYIDYNVVKGAYAGEKEPHYGNFFVKARGASSYCVFMGGDYRTAKVTGTGGTPGRKLLIVKDSFGNAMVPALFGSFEEVHVIDHRYFPSNLLDYVRRQGITDLAFVNAISLAFSPKAATRLNTMRESKVKGHEFEDE